MAVPCSWSKRDISSTLLYLLLTLLVLFVFDKLRILSQLKQRVDPRDQYHISEKYGLNIDKYRQNVQRFTESHPIPSFHLPNINGSKIKNWVNDHRPHTLDHLLHDGLPQAIHYLESSLSLQKAGSYAQTFVDDVYTAPSTAKRASYEQCPVDSSISSSCDAENGWSYLLSWFNKMEPTKIITGLSEVTCLRDSQSDSNAHTFCGAKNAQIDFSKMVTVEKSTRSFSSGFIRTFGTRIALDPQIGAPGYEHVHSTAKVGCEVIIDEPTFILSNDDIYNLGHYMNDVMGIWTMLVLSARRPSQARLLNIDGYRRAGPSGGLPHRIMNVTDPDNHGPYSDYLLSWFKKLDRATDFGQKKVCFKELYFPPSPTIAWFWKDWSRVNQCSLEGKPSSIYQSFHMFMKNSWNDKFGSETSFSHTPSSSSSITSLSKAAAVVETASSAQNNNSTSNYNQHQYHLVLETRSIDKLKTSNNHSIARYIRNSFILLNILSETIPNLKVTQVNLADISFRDQVDLMRSADIFMSMHGQGSTHIFNMDIGRPRCCALVELQPDHSIGFQNSYGFGNLARLLGLKYYRLDAADGATTSSGTTIDVRKAAELVIEAIVALDESSTCVRDLKDTREPILRYPFLDK